MKKTNQQKSDSRLEEKGFYLSQELLTNSGVVLKEANILWYHTAFFLATYECTKTVDESVEATKKDPSYLEKRQDKIRHELMNNSYKTNLRIVKKCPFFPEELHYLFEMAFRESEYILKEMFMDLSYMKDRPEDVQQLTQFVNDTIDDLATLNDYLFTMKDSLLNFSMKVVEEEKKRNRNNSK